MAQRRRSRIQHSRVLGHPSGGAFSLQRELGKFTAASTAGQNQSWARGLEKWNVFEEEGHMEVSQFVVDEATGAIIYEQHGATNKVIGLQ